MKVDSEKIKQVYERTDGYCHLCRKKLSWCNYGEIDGKGAWEIDHSIPRSKNGTDTLKNLYPACTSCNRSKQNSSTTTARAVHGFKRAPCSKKQRVHNTWSGGAIGTLACLFVPPQFRLVAAIGGALIGAFLGHNSESDWLNVQCWRVQFVQNRMLVKHIVTHAEYDRLCERYRRGLLW